MLNDKFNKLFNIIMEEVNNKKPNYNFVGGLEVKQLKAEFKKANSSDSVEIQCEQWGGTFYVTNIWYDEDYNAVLIQYVKQKDKPEKTITVGEVLKELANVNDDVKLFAVSPRQTSFIPSYQAPIKSINGNVIEPYNKAEFYLYT